VLAVTGEAGIGKTSLVEDFLTELDVSRHRPVIARGRCSERLAGSEAYLPLLEVLDSLLHRTHGESFGELMKTCAPTWFLQVATLSPDGSTIQKMQADQRTASQERMKREMGALLQEISRITPLVISLDDLHWADVSTVDLLNYVAGRFENMRVLVLGTYRRSEMTLSDHSWLQVKSTLEGAVSFASCRSSSWLVTTWSVTSRSSSKSIGSRASSRRSSTTKPKATRSSWLTCCATSEIAECWPRMVVDGY
jgi:hypothetical protein